MKKDISAFLKAKENSPFTKSFASNYANFRHDLVSGCIEQIFEPEEYVPVFQRANDKWTKKMQIKFIENLVLGLTSQISLYTVSKNEFPKWLILDGFQRLTAVNLFIYHKLEIFNGLTYDDIKANIDGGVNQLQFRLYRFNNEIEAVEFYIAMNENITHSKKDIQRAKDYLAQLKA